MLTMETLYLTKGELKLWQKLPARLKKVWGGRVEEEKGTAYETGEHLKKRYEALAESKDKETMAVMRHLRVQKTLDGLRPELLSTVLLLLGASGISLFLQQFIVNAKTLSDLSDIASLSAARHVFLETNVDSPLHR